jgi:molybdopterin synthase sulfur carrier subunit
MVRILFLGPLRDDAGAEHRDVPGPLDWAGLLQAVGPEVRDALLDDRVNVACAGRVLVDKSMLHADGEDEVALLPPVSGG